MKITPLLPIVVLSFTLLFACTTKTANESEETVDVASAIDFRIADNYFVRNTVEGTVPEKITSQAEFEEYFGMATTMGEGGKPTSIDFPEEYVIVVDHGNTTKEVKLNPASLTSKAGDLILEYNIQEGKDLGFTSRPFLLIIVPDSVSGNVVLSPAAASN